MRHAFLVAAALILAAPASAHDLWLAPGQGGVHVHYGHPHEPDMPSIAKLMSLTAYDASGATPLVAKAATGTVWAARQGDALVAASYDNGYWVRLDDGSYRNASKRAVPQASKSLWSMKFAKTVLGPSAPWDRVVGQLLEIVPMEDPSAASGTIRVQVLFEGRPLADASVVATDGVNFKSEADQARAETGADGRALVPLRTAGPQVLSVSHRVRPSQTPELADADAYSATFAFTITDPKTN